MEFYIKNGTREDGMEKRSLWDVLFFLQAEPYVLLQSPAIWPYQEGWLLNMSIDEFEMQGEECKEEILKNIFCKGLSDRRLLLGEH